MDEPTISFTEEDAKRLHHPHNDAIIITLTIANFITKKVLVYNGSLVNILYYLAFKQMGINKERLCLASAP